MRPGLKFLVQKVAQTNVAANLYKQAGVSWTIHMVALFELCMSSSGITLDTVKSNLRHQLKSDNIEDEGKLYFANIITCIEKLLFKVDKKIFFFII